MESVLSGSIYFIYVWWLISLFNNKNFSPKMKISQAYILSIALRLFGGYDSLTVLATMLIALFFCEEYFNPDTGKTNFLKNLGWKIVDYFFRYIYLYKILYPVLGIVLSDIVRECVITTLCYDEAFANNISRLIASALTFWGIHRMYAERIVFKDYNDILENQINKVPYYKLYEGKNEVEREILRKRFELIAAIEDRYFFDRKGYSILNWSQIKLYIREYGFFKLVKKVGYSRGIGGHSTIEMQLLRILFFKSGLTFNRNSGRGMLRRWKEIIFRKIYELLFTPIFFAALKEYIQEKATKELTYYKDYIIFLYLNTVISKINGKRFDPASAFLKETGYNSCEEIFVLALGLNTAPITEERVNNYSAVIEEYKLDLKKVEKAINEFGKERVDFKRKVIAE